MKSSKYILKNLREKCLVFAIILIFILSIGTNAFAIETISINDFELLEYSDEYKEYLELSEEEKKNTIMPRMFNIEYQDVQYYNPLRVARLLGSSLVSSYNLQDVIPENVVVRDQQQTNTCWAFAAISSLETNLALKNYKNGISPIVYNFSERHMEYATSRTFSDGINIGSFNREVGSGSNYYVSSAYLTNGTGAINENQMVFENNENSISLSEIQGKTVTTQVYDTIEFPTEEPTTVTQSMINQIKEHIMNNGSVFACVHGAQRYSNCYNNDTGALYCDGTESNCQADHAVSIIGWDDDYGVLNFNKEPSKPGAWIIKNSWGERKEYELSELREEIFKNNEQKCIDNGWTEATLIPDYVITENGYTIEGDKAYLSIGKNGIMYVSYEDVYIYKNLWGILNASDCLDYENIYQYNDLGYNAGFNVLNFFKTQSENVYIANSFEKKTTGKEYITQVGINVFESCTCKVYVGTGLNAMKIVELKTGNSEKLDGAGYHTLEFLNPIEVPADNFYVEVEIQDSVDCLIEGQITTYREDGTIDVTYSDVDINGFFVSLDGTSWRNVIDADCTIKAFTTSQIVDDTLKEIKVTTEPKTEYFVGEDFDKAGMVVTAYYNNGQEREIDGYDIINGTNLQKEQTSVRIEYQDKSVELPITVKENTVTSIIVKNPPDKIEYIAGEDFDKTGMIIEATFEDDNKKYVTDYKIVDGKNLKNGQTSVTIEYKEKTTTQEITVKSNLVEKIEITNKPNKLKYIVGQDFDSTGMIVEATYEDGNKYVVTDYTIVDGKNLQLDKKEVTIKFEDKTTTQEITVEEKTVNSIFVKKMPTKTQYIQDTDNLDLTGGEILAKYNDGTEESISMLDNNIETSGFSNKDVGTVKITLKYQSCQTSFEITVVAKQQQNAEEKKEEAENSKLDKATCNVLKVQSYQFTDKTKEEYLIMELEVENIERYLKNDSVTYYYYLSTKQSENNIQDWVKIEENQTNSNKLVFKINSKDIKNYDELASSNVLYLYIREIAVKGGSQKVEISNAIKVQSTSGIEEYLDNVKQDVENNKQTDNTNNNTNTDNKKDDTISQEKIPNAGKTAIVTIVLIITVGIGIISYQKYRRLKGIK